MVICRSWRAFLARIGWAEWPEKGEWIASTLAFSTCVITWIWATKPSVENHRRRRRRTPANRGRCRESANCIPPAGEPPYSQPDMGLGSWGFLGLGCWWLLLCWGSCALPVITLVISRHLMSTNRARIVLSQPRKNAIGMVDVFTRHLPRLPPDFELIGTDSAVWLNTQMLLRNLHRRHRVNGAPGGRRRPAPATVRKLLTQVLHKLIQRIRRTVPRDEELNATIHRSAQQKHMIRRGHHRRRDPLAELLYPPAGWFRITRPVQMAHQGMHSFHHLHVMMVVMMMMMLRPSPSMHPGRHHHPATHAHSPIHLEVLVKCSNALIAPTPHGHPSWMAESFFKTPTHFL